MSTVSWIPLLSVSAAEVTNMAKKNTSDNAAVAAQEAVAATDESTGAPAEENVTTANVEPDGVDEAAAGEWEDVEERLLCVKYPNGIYLRIGPGTNFAPLQVLPNGTTVTALPLPEYARVPGWLCVAVEMFHGQTVHGWVNASLVEEIEI